MNIPFRFNLDEYHRRIHLNRHPESRDQVDHLLKDILPVIAPKALYRTGFIGQRFENTLQVDHVRFISDRLSAVLSQVERVFPYIVTCGDEIDRVPLDSDDFFVRFWIDTLKEMVLEQACQYLESHLKERYFIEELASVNPGSGDPDFWPIEQQRELFALLGNVEMLIGVRLTESCLMVPNKTISGLFFASEARFETCRFCSRKNCPKRRAR